MKTFLAFLLLLATVAVICYPLYVVWLGISSVDVPVWGRLALLLLGLVLCRLVKPVSILTGKDFKYF